MWSERRDNHLFVFFNGDIIFKVWYDQAYSMVFDSIGLPFSLKEKWEPNGAERP